MLNVGMPQGQSRMIFGNIDGTSLRRVNERRHSFPTLGVRVGAVNVAAEILRPAAYSFLSVVKLQNELMNGA